MKKEEKQELRNLLKIGRKNVILNGFVEDIQYVLSLTNVIKTDVNCYETIEADNPFHLKEGDKIVLTGLRDEDDWNLGDNDGESFPQIKFPYQTTITNKCSLQGKHLENPTVDVNGEDFGLAWFVVDDSRINKLLDICEEYNKLYK